MQGFICETAAVAMTRGGGYIIDRSTFSRVSGIAPAGLAAAEKRDGARQAEDRKEYDDIPGTYVFDADRSRVGYHLNMFCMSLMKAENRKAFKADEPKYLDQFPLTTDQREAVLKREYNRLLELGGNIYFTAKLGATDGHPFQHLAAVMTGSTQQDYADLMLRGGRSVEGNRSRTGRFETPKSGKPKASKGKNRRG